MLMVVDITLLKAMLMSINGVDGDVTSTWNDSDDAVLVMVTSLTLFIAVMAVVACHGCNTKIKIIAVKKYI